MRYDRLVIATGARPVRPDLPGSTLEGVFLLHTMDDSFAIHRSLKERNPRTAVLVGAGYIGLGDGRCSHPARSRRYASLQSGHGAADSRPSARPLGPRRIGTPRCSRSDRRQRGGDKPSGNRTHIAAIDCRLHARSSTKRTSYFLRSALAPTVNSRNRPGRSSALRAPSSSRGRCAQTWRTFLRRAIASRRTIACLMRRPISRWERSRTNRGGLRARMRLAGTGRSRAR